MKTMAVRRGGAYVVTGQKVWISRAEHSDLMLLMARTTPLEQVEKRSDGLSMLLVDMRSSVGHGLTIRPIRTMMNHATTELFFDGLEVPADNLIGEEGRGFRYLLDGLNAERILIAAECVGDGRWFIDRATRYAKDRRVFGRAIGQNQGVQFPIARAHVNVDAADLMRIHAADLFDRGESCGAEANMAKLLAADASWGRGQRGGADARRLWLCRRLRHRAEIQGNAPVSGRAHLHELDSQLCRRARPWSAEILLMLGGSKGPALRTRRTPHSLP